MILQLLLIIMLMYTSNVPNFGSSVRTSSYVKPSSSSNFVRRSMHNPEQHRQFSLFWHSFSTLLSVSFFIRELRWWKTKFKNIDQFICYLVFHYINREQLSIGLLLHVLENIQIKKSLTHFSSNKELRDSLSICRI